MITFARVKNGSGEGSNKVTNWTPRHEAIVFDRISGMNLTQISDKYNLNETMISLVCNTKQGKALIKQVSEQIHAEKYATLPEQRKAAIALAQQRMYDFLGDDSIQHAAPLACAPINAKFFQVLSDAEKPAGSVVGNTYQTIQVNVLNNPEKRDALAAGLERMREVSALHSGVIGETVEVRKELIPLPATDLR